MDIKDRNDFDKESLINYEHLRIMVENCVELAGKTTDFKGTKIELINVQNDLKNTKLRYESRQELWERLNEAFEILRHRQSTESMGNYYNFRHQIDQLVAEAKITTNYRETRERLIHIQGEFKTIVLTKEHRDELWNLMQTAFDTLSHRQDSEHKRFEMDSQTNYHDLNQKIDQILRTVEITPEIRETREKLKDLQGNMRELKLTKEQRDELWNKLNHGFERLSQRMESSHQHYETECYQNYMFLKKKVEVAEQKAVKSIDFNEARSFIQSIQGSFKGIKLLKEQREELWQRITTAYQTLLDRSNDM